MAAMGGAYSEKEWEVSRAAKCVAATASFAAIRRARALFLMYRPILRQSYGASFPGAGAASIRFRSGNAGRLRPNVGFMAGRIGETS